jgi:hypothetical protein
MKDDGARGRGDAKFFWKKTWQMRGYALTEEHKYKLDELAEIRARLFDGRVRSDDKVDNMLGRQQALLDMLYIDGVDVEYRKEAPCMTQMTK